MEYNRPIGWKRFALKVTGKWTIFDRKVKIPE